MTGADLGGGPPEARQQCGQQAVARVPQQGDHAAGWTDVHRVSSSRYSAQRSSTVWRVSAAMIGTIRMVWAMTWLMA